MTAPTKLYTIEEFEHILGLPENRDRLLELIEGEIVEKMVIQEHGMIAGNIHAILWNFIKPRKLGRLAIEARYQIPADLHNARLPDISFVADMSEPIVTRGGVPQMPDFAIEVKSPDDMYKQMREKADYYLQNGTKLVWLVYPEKRIVEVYTNEQQDILTLEDRLTGGELLPEFELSVKDIFDVE